MFLSHTKYTKLAYLTIVANSLLGFLSLGAIIPLLTDFELNFTYIVTSVLVLMLFVNLYIAYLIYKRSFFVLKLCLWLYGLQIFAFDFGSFSFSMIFGTKFLLTWSIGNFSISFNIFALVIWAIVKKALLSLESVHGQSS